MDRARSTWRGDIAVAAAVGLALAIAWTVRDWTTLSLLRLPDTDDVMRLQQVRDWLAGQPFADVSQHRMGDGVAMHWSRLADLGPAAIITALAPVAGRQGAELVAVLLWPTCLFVVALTLIARIARALGGEDSARTAIVVAALAYPATTVFAPGRIDHHGLQIVLLLAGLLAMLAPSTAGRGAIAGVCAAASLVIGLETAPLLVVMAGWAAIDLVRSDRDRRAAGFGGGLAIGLIVARTLFATEGWRYPACDGFTVEPWSAASIGAGALLFVGLVGPMIARRGARLTVALVMGGVAAVAAVAVSPRCLSPYGGVDPRLVSLWLSQVQEAQPLLAADRASAIGYAGLALVGLAASAWRVWTVRSRGWLLLFTLQIAAVAIMSIQLRGAYAAAILGVPALATMVAAARASGVVALVAAWIAAAGIAYPLAARPIAATGPARPGGDCASPAMLAALDSLSPGLVMAPIDTGAWLIGGTRQRAVAAPYHRNGEANLDMYRFYLGTPATAATVLARRRVDYVVACGAMPMRDRSMGAALARGIAPGLHRLVRLDDGAAIYAR